MQMVCRPTGKRGCYVAGMRSATVSGPRGRTRRAILEAAPLVLYRDRGATLADIAKAAGVGRSTLHRHFPDRAALLSAVVADSVEAVQRSVAEADPDNGPALEAMRRLVAAMVQVGDHLLFLFGDSRTFEDAGSGGEEWGASEEDGGVKELVRRGQEEGDFDPELTPEWIEGVLWALVYTGCEMVERGDMPRHGIGAAVVRMLENGIRGPREPRT